MSNLFPFVLITETAGVPVNRPRCQMTAIRRTSSAHTRREIATLTGTEAIRIGSARHETVIRQFKQQQKNKQQI